ncbi:MAG TPA: cation transporter [Rhodospirillaceae bacterium]|nr:cation transporter [Magnetovibrio sp.]HBT44004.1 cation transporter [Rhodospirillaceae bacterium]HCS69937.1 cation transporter [Rhodospirillaceae bacterium]|tara:strand:- start:1536 stop:2189 length:654 start_codon:yes stop_codon:yes gene_type:complete
MSACCDHGHDHSPFTDAAASQAYRRVLWFALIVNGAMFFGELAGAYLSKSVALQADALDFLGDAANYGISLAVVGMHLAWRARAAMVKGLSMGLFGLWVIGTTVWRIAEGGVPEAHIITGVGVLALAANLAVTVALFKFREGDANMRSVWLCSRNDAIANVAVIAAGGGVWLTGTFWPDVAVGGIIAGLALFASAEVIRRARGELRQAREPLPAAGD